MICIIEWDGVLMDIGAMYHAAHRSAAAAVGWSALDSARFRAALKKQGTEASVLPSAPPLKVKQYQDHFMALVDTEPYLKGCTAPEGMAATVRRVANHGTICWVTLGGNVTLRQTMLDGAGVSAMFQGSAGLPPDPRLRPSKIKSLAAGDRRALVVAASEPLIRAVGGADVLAVGISTGMVSPARLHQAGADVVYGDLSELADSLDRGAPDLVRAGLLPLPLGG